MSYNIYDQMSIFGRTYSGVPSPNIPHRHPYPTRYHGYVSSVPRFGLPYKPASYIAPGVWSWPIPRWPETKTIVRDWTQIGSPPPVLGSIGACSGTGGFGEPVLCASTGNVLLDAAIGAGIGYLAAPTKKHAAYWAAAGAAGAALAGTLGVVVVAGAALYKRSRPS